MSHPRRQFLECFIKRIMRRRMSEIIIAIIILVLSISLLLLTPQQVLTRKIAIRSVPLKTWVMPFIGLSMVAILSIVLIATTYLSRKTHMDRLTTSLNESPLRVIITYIILALGVWSINVLGFISTSVIMTGVLLTYFGVRNYFVILILGVMIPVFIYLFFTVGMKIPLPRGALF